MPIIDQTLTLLAPSAHADIDRTTRLTELTVHLHLIRAKASSYERRLNEMLTIVLNDGADPMVVRDATGLTFDEMLNAERNAFGARLNDNARLRLLALVDEVPHYGQLGDGSRLVSVPAGLLQHP